MTLKAESIVSMSAGTPRGAIGDTSVDLRWEEVLGILGRLLRGVLRLVWRGGMGGGRLLARLGRMRRRESRIPAEVGLAEGEAVGVGAGGSQGRHGERVGGS